MQWTQDKLRHRADKKRESMKKEDVVERWDEKRRETATWASDHKATLHPPYPDSTQPTPESISEPSSALCSTLLMTSLSKTNSPAIPLALPSGATGVMKGPEEVEVVAVGLQSALCMCVFPSVCAKRV